MAKINKLYFYDLVIPQEEKGNWCFYGQLFLGTLCCEGVTHMLFCGRPCAALDHVHSQYVSTDGVHTACFVFPKEMFLSWMWCTSLCISPSILWGICNPLFVIVKKDQWAVHRPGFLFCCWLILPHHTGVFGKHSLSLPWRCSSAGWGWCFSSRHAEKSVPTLPMLCARCARWPLIYSYKITVTSHFVIGWSQRCELWLRWPTDPKVCCHKDCISLMKQLFTSVIKCAFELCACQTFPGN